MADKEMEMAGAACEAAEHFDLPGSLENVRRFGHGHINGTFLLQCKAADGADRRVILQRINTTVFKEPEHLMDNIVGVTSWLRRKITEEGGDPKRETLTLVPTMNGAMFYVDGDRQYWRAYHFISGATCYDLAQSDEDFRQSAVAFGTFQRRLADYPAATLYEAIPGFHDTAARLEHFREAVRADALGRAKDVQKEIEFVESHAYLADVYARAEAEHPLPRRVTHNDTKLNNVMIDDKTHRGLCVIDLDTVMPGYVMNDFGDSIRFGASTALEDEPDLSKVSCSLELFTAYTQGFMQECGERLTPQEKALLPDGALIMTYECGMRFLADYLEGDIYFHIERPAQNLDRARNQFRLVADMEAKLPQMREIVAKADRA